MHQWLLDFLKGLESVIPPPANCHHVITFAQYGSDQDGWEDRLALQVNVGGKFYCFFFDANDMTQEPRKIIESIGELLKSADATAQFGVSCGQYLA
jgi:hypothetical protein